VGLNQLAGTGIHFFTLLFLDDDKKIIGTLRFSENYFDRFKLYVETGEFDQEEQLLVPLPIPPTEDMILALGNGVHSGQTNLRPPDESYYKMMIDIWQLSQYRGNCKQEGPEKKWLENLEEKYAISIHAHVAIVYQAEIDIIKPSKKEVLQFLDGEKTYSTAQIVEMMNARAAAAM